MREGYKFNGFTLVGKGTIQSIPSLYHLLPNKTFFASNSTTYYGEEMITVEGMKRKVTHKQFTYNEVAEMIKNQMNSGLFEEAERFHESMTDNVGQYVDFYRIIGDNYYTVGYIKNYDFCGSVLETHNGEFVNMPDNVTIRTNDNVVELVIEGTNEYTFQINPSASYSNTIGVEIKKMDGTQELHSYLDLAQGAFMTKRDSTGVAAGYDIDGNGTIDESIESPSDPGGEDPSEPGDSEHPDIQIDIEGETGNVGWRKSPVVISIDSSIELSDPTAPDTLVSELDEAVVSYRIDNESEQIYNGAFTYSAQGKHQVTAFVRDPEGNLLGEATRNFKIDTVRPNTQAQASGLSGDNGWLLSDVKISVTASDETSKLASVKYSVDGSPMIDYSGPKTITMEGIHSIAAEAQDNAGGVQPLDYSFKIDKSKPVIADVYLQDEYYWGQTFPIEFKTDDAISGVETIKATINGKEPTPGGTYTFTEPGWHTYKIEVKDNAGWTALFETRFEVYIPARIDFDPDHLQLDHGSGMATLRIQLPEPFEPQRIRFSTQEYEIVDPAINLPSIYMAM